VLKVKAYGYPPVEAELAKLMSEKYGVVFDQVAGCDVTDELIERIRGYNEVMAVAIARKYGEGVMQEAEAELERRRHPAAPRPIPVPPAQSKNQRP
jgi:hypothetical protein